MNRIVLTPELLRPGLRVYVFAPEDLGTIVWSSHRFLVFWDDGEIDELDEHAWAIVGGTPMAIVWAGEDA